MCIPLRRNQSDSARGMMCAFSVASMLAVMRQDMSRWRTPEDMCERVTTGVKETGMLNALRHWGGIVEGERTQSVNVAQTG